MVTKHGFLLTPQYVADAGWPARKLASRQQYSASDCPTTLRLTPDLSSSTMAWILSKYVYAPTQKIAGRCQAQYHISNFTEPRKA